jgi:septal ring factor EnvC (AmiA/AmiB activator)
MRDMMKEETWMNASVAIEHGFVDEVISGASKAPKNSACHSLAETHSRGMGLFTTKAEWENKVEGLNARIGELEADVTASAEALTTAQNELATASETITGHVAKISELELRNAELEKELIAANEALEAAAAAKDAAEKSAGVKASEILASAGHPPVEVTAEDSADASNASKTPHLDKFNTLTGTEKSAFYQANAAAIRKEMTIH